MEDEEDLFSMLDGINHATNDYQRDEQGHGGRAMRRPTQNHGSQYHDAGYAQQEDTFLSDHEYHSYQPQQAAPDRSMMAPSRATRRHNDHSAGLFVSSAANLQVSAPQNPSPGIGERMAQYTYQPSSPVPEAASSPAYRASQKMTEYSGLRPKVTQPGSREPSTPQQTAARSEASVYPPKKPDFLSTHALPDRFRSVFPYPNFNAMQTKCFPIVYQSNDNFVLSSPTGSGKTVIFELAICRVVNTFPAGQFKVVYQAPTKSLCSERQRDWQQKFRMFGIDCAELTGDTDPAQLRNVQAASIIVTTPEKWDSITRKWKDHEKLISMIRLFLIDEVHMLHEARGATLEAVVSRMKSVQSEVRFIALSATVPNSSDIATWLGRDHEHQDIPAREERFGEEFRPVLLQKHVVGYAHGGNEFSFDKMLDSKLPEVIAQYSHRKPIMVFCITRKAAENTARLLASWWASKNAKDQYWRAPRQNIRVEDKDLQQCIPAAVAWHHAGLSYNDRNAIEQGFRDGDINVICCTSTLAVGVNLPCHMIILKNTLTYANGEGISEYSDIEVMQMLGRAGRPQYDTSAVAVIMTRQEKAKKYEKMVSGEQILESCLHENLIDHLNAEIGLGAVTNLASAKKWLTSTFLYVRLKANPNHYKIDDGTGEINIDARLENMCCRDIDLLRETRLVEGESKLESTVYGEAMARYYVKFETAKIFLSLPKGATISEIISALAMASEWADIRFRSGEKTSYKDLNKSPQIRFPIPVNLDIPAHKVSLIIQSQLGSVNLPVNEKASSNLFQYQTDTFLVFQHLRRLIRCVIDFKYAEGDSVALRNALFMCRSIGARCWDDSPMVLKQLEKIGPAGVLKLVKAGVRSVEALENTEPHRIEMALNRNPPFGMQVVAAARAFPKLRISVSVLGKPTIKAGQGAKINVDAEIGFLNDIPTTTSSKIPVFIVFLAETSDGKSVHFARTSAKKIGKGQKVRFGAMLTSPTQTINCYVMCEEIAGTCTSITLKPTLPSIAWPQDNADKTSLMHDTERVMNTSKKRTPTCGTESRVTNQAKDEFDDVEVDEDELYAALIDVEKGGFRDIDTIGVPRQPERTMRKDSAKTSGPSNSTMVRDDFTSKWQPVKMDNGKWGCNHRCKDKQSCKHMCCREGSDKPPKAPKQPTGAQGKEDVYASTKQSSSKLPKGQTKLAMGRLTQRGKMPSMEDDIELLDLSRPKAEANPKPPKSEEYRRLDKLHSATQNTRAPSATSLVHPARTRSNAFGTPQHLSFLPQHMQPPEEEKEPEDESTDYGAGISDFDMPDDPVPPRGRFENDAAMVADFTGIDKVVPRTAAATSTTQGYSEADSLLEDAMVGLADSQNMQQRVARHEDHSRLLSERPFDETDDLMEEVAYAKPIKSTSIRAPFFETSSPVAVEVAAGAKRQVPVRYETENPAPKKPRTASVEQNVARITEKPRMEDESSEPLSEIDPMILQMFGSYVDFV